VVETALVTAIAAQDRLDLAALEGGVACFGTRSPTHAVTLLDVVGAEAALASADDAIQEELLAGRAQFLNAQTTPFQVLLRAEPVDLEGHLARVRARAEQLPAALRTIALEYIQFLQALAQQRTLLERHCYVILPDHRAEIPVASLSRRLQAFFRLRRDSGVERSDDPEIVSSSVARRLHARSDLVARQLGRSGLHTRRLASQQVAKLLHRCGRPSSRGCSVYARSSVHIRAWSSALPVLLVPDPPTMRARHRLRLAAQALVMQRDCSPWALAAWLI
jgi:hypothetical protein